MLKVNRISFSLYFGKIWKWNFACAKKPGQKIKYLLRALCGTKIAWFLSGNSPPVSLTIRFSRANFPFAKGTARKNVDEDANAIRPMTGGYSVSIGGSTTTWLRTRACALRTRLMRAEGGCERAQRVRGTPVEHSFTNARACKPTDAARGYVRHIRRPCTRGPQVCSLIPLRCPLRAHLGREQRSRWSRAKKKKKNGIEESIGTSAIYRFIEVYPLVYTQKTMRHSCSILKGRKIVQLLWKK